MEKENILTIRQRIARASSNINQDPGRITVVAVAKGRALEQIKEVIEAGITDIGENRVQEAVLKYDSVRATPYAVQPKWHMVGHLQTNKVKDAVRIFDLIQSVDSLRLAEEIDKHASRTGKTQNILIEIKTSSEDSKSGLNPDGAIEVIKVIGKLKNINILGLMTIAPLAADPEDVRPYFRKLKELLNNLNLILNTQYSILSMGMTDDFEVAIEEGANMVRLGRAIFD
jgi:pyridoxal phosphate enzyme (YggS family)